jgi:hypothetical protein
MLLCDKSKYNCGLIITSSCVPYTGHDLTVLRDPSLLPCNANINEVIGVFDFVLKEVIDGNDLTNLNARCLAFTPSIVKINQLHQIEIDQICANSASLASLQTQFNDLNIGTEPIQINLLCLTPAAAACLTPPNTYPLIAVLNTFVNEICTLITDVANISIPQICTDGVTILGNGTLGNCLRTGTVPPSSLPFADFFGLTAGTGNVGPTDYPSTIPVKTSVGTGRVPFPRNGATIAGAATRIDSSSFTLPNVGTYEIIFSVHTTEPGQLQVELNGVDISESVTPNMNPTAGGHPIFGYIIVTTTLPNEIVAIVNADGNSTALTITPPNGANTHANAQRLIIKQIA